MISPSKPAAQGATLGGGSQEPPPNRWIAILYIAFCFEMGIFLFVFPWVSVWHHNFFVARYAWVSTLAHNYYVRGAISGMGLVDVFLAFYELWRMRAPLGLVRSRAAR